MDPGRDLLRLADLARSGLGDHHDAGAAIGGRRPALREAGGLDYQIEQGRGDKTAILWQGDEPDDSKAFTYSELKAEVERFANVLKDLGVQKGDPVAIYLPMIPELPIAMLACARIGAIHSVVFGGFSADALRSRVEDGEAKLVVTC